MDGVGVLFLGGCCGKVERSEKLVVGKGSLGKDKSSWVLTSLSQDELKL